MKVTPIKTHRITVEDKDLYSILDRYIPRLSENSVVAVTSKIVAICEGRVMPLESVDKDVLIEQESEYYLPRKDHPYQVSLTITNSTLVATAGIDESNANGNYILWPQNPQESVNTIRNHLKKKHNLKNIGVIITDSRTTPLRWGVTAFSIASSGFLPLKDYTNTEDLFGRKFQFEKLNIADSFATSAALVMGEGAEQTPIAVIEDIPFVQFVDRNPTREEIDQLKISIDEDIYSPILKKVEWKKGKS